LPINEKELAVTLRLCDAFTRTSRYFKRKKTYLIVRRHKAFIYLEGKNCLKYSKRNTDKKDPPPDPTCSKSASKLYSSNKDRMPLSVNLK